MNILLTGAMGAGLAVAVAIAWGDLAQDPTLSPASLEDELRAGQFDVLMAGEETGCRLSMTGDPDQQSGALGVGEGCSDLIPEMSTIRFWQEAEDGSITLSGISGTAVYSFAVSDGAAYESYYPQAPLIALVARN